MTPDRDPMMDNIMNGMTAGSGDVISGSFIEHSLGQQTFVFFFFLFKSEMFPKQRCSPNISYLKISVIRAS